MIAGAVQDGGRRHQQKTAHNRGLVAQKRVGARGVADASFCLLVPRFLPLTKRSLEDVADD